MDVKIVDFSLGHFLPLKADPVQQQPHAKNILGLFMISLWAGLQKGSTPPKKGKIIVGWSKKLMLDTPTPPTSQIEWPL